MGAGHLNVGNALKNFIPGEQEPGIVSNIGWDFNNIGGPGLTDQYIFDTPLAANAWVAVTLTWDRVVELTDPDNTYSFGDEFFDYSNLDQVLNNLNIYVVPANATDVTMPTRASISEVDNVEHIFFKVPSAGEYKVVVTHEGGLGIDQDYAIAWWAGEAPAPTAGDFDEDGDVDQDDLGDWKDGFGPMYDGADFLAWQQNYGFGVPAAPMAVTVPEPSTAIFGVISLVAMTSVRRNAN